MTAILKLEEKPKVKIDLGCGPNKQKDHIGLDRVAFDGVDHQLDLGVQRWPFDDATVDEAYTSHFLEHLRAHQRVHFCNELYRVLVPGGKCTLIVPHWSSGRAYGDPTHEWPPVSDMWFLYLNREWRLGDKEKNIPANAPHTDIKHWREGFDCDFDATWGYGLNPALLTRSQDYQQFAINFYREAVWDLHATLTKK